MSGRILSGIVLGALALGVAWIATGGATSGDLRPAPDRGGEAELAAELRRLADVQERTAAALERIERALAAQTLARNAPPGARRADPGGSAPPAADELVASLETLRETLAAESARTQDLIRRAPWLGGDSLSETRRRLAGANWIALEELESAWRDDPTLADRSQYFQTPRDLLETYGPPAAIYRPKRGGLQFVYRRHLEGQAGPAWYFQVQDGIVVQFFVEDELPAEDG